MSLPLFWSHTGEATELPPFPDFSERWFAGQPEAELDELYRVVREDLEKALFLRVVEFSVRVANNNLVAEVEYDNGRRDIVRTDNPHLSEDEVDPESAARHRRHAELLRWLRARTTIPIPEIRAVIEPPRPGAPPIVAMEKMPGTIVLNAIGRAPYAVKERLMHAFADVQIQLFRLDVPQRIGTPHFEDGEMVVIPHSAAPRADETLESYVNALLAAERRSLAEQDAETQERGARVLDRVSAELPAIYARLADPQVYRRCVLKHDDLAPTNVLMNEHGDITGVIDWDYQLILPAVLAVEFPQWIRYEGALAPEYYTGRDDNFEVLWFVSPEDATKLRDAYIEIAKAKDREYADALVDGDVLRQIVEWLGSGKDYALMERWMGTVFIHE